MVKRGILLAISIITSINEITSFQTKLHKHPSSQNTHLSLKHQTKLHANKKRGIYSRPSAAIEKGSGFFVPGLEGGRVRIVFGITLLLANIVNDTVNNVSTTTTNQIGFTEWVGIVFALIIILQGVLEDVQENTLIDEPADVNSRMEVVQNSKPTLSSILVDQLRWVGLTIFSFTSTNKFLIWDNTDSFCFTLSPSKLGDVDPNVIQAARQSLSVSQTGTISVPNTHPIGAILEEGDCGVILQRISEDDSWGMVLVTDRDVQVAFTKNDFRWLPVLARLIRSFI